MKILQLSDLHFQVDASLSPFGPLDWRQLYARLEFIWEGRPPLFLDAGKRVSAFLDTARREGVDHLLVSGDLTAVSLGEEFELAREALRPFEQDLTLLPGNHDRTSRRSAAGFEATFGDLLSSDVAGLSAPRSYPLVRLLGEDAAIVALDSTRVPFVPGLATGRLGAGQLSALKTALEHPRLRGRGVLVALHHAPFLPSGIPDNWHHGLTDAAEFLSIVDAAGVAAVCHGHIHRRYRIDRPGKTPILGCGSSTQKGRAGYVTIELGAGGLGEVRLVDVEAA